MVKNRVEVAFRTNASSSVGIGHLYRCLELASEFDKLGVRSILFVDNVNENIEKICANRNVFCVYQDGVFEGEEADYFRFKGLVKEFGVNRIIVDDYRLGVIWEQMAEEDGFLVCALDDSLRAHSCSIIVDQKWRGDEGCSYDDISPVRSRILTGPKYAIVNNNYLAARKRVDTKFQVLISLGGGGNAEDIIEIIEPFLNIPLSDFRIKVVCGPMLQNAHLLNKEIYRRYPIEFVFGLMDLSDLIIDSDLFVGAAGGTLYQCMAAGVPMITFSLAKNQENNRDNLSDLGHYFHFNSNEVDTKKIASLAFCIKNNYGRVIRLKDQKRFNIDCRGAARICTALLGEEKIFEYPVVSTEPKEWESASRFHRIRSVDDSDINRYLDARNRAENSEKMNVNVEISRADHYLWWFQNKREKFVVESNGVENIFIWHEAIVHGEGRFLVGGWFVRETKIEPFDVITAVDWQIKKCKKLYPNTPWLAIIKRGNKFVRTLNAYFNFKEIEDSGPYADAIKAVFNVSTNREFHFLVGDVPASVEGK